MSCMNKIKGMIIASVLILGLLIPSQAFAVNDTTPLPAHCAGLTVSRCPPPDLQTYDPSLESKPTSTQQEPTTTRGTYVDSRTGLVYDIPLVGDYCLDFNEDGICDVDFKDGNVIVYELDNESGDGDNNDDNKKEGNDCWEGTKFIGKDKCDTKGNPLCSEVNFEVECFDDKDYPQPDNDNDLDEDSNDNGDDCQSQDDFCDNDEGCESESVDCIDDRGFDEDDYNG